MMKIFVGYYCAKLNDYDGGEEHTITPFATAATSLEQAKKFAMTACFGSHPTSHRYYGHDADLVEVPKLWIQKYL